jgi:plasmid stabilization system protein ParE
MVRKIIWTKTADHTFDEITGFLQDKSSLQAAQSFAKTVYAKINTLTEQPYIGRLSKKAKTVRIINISKNTPRPEKASVLKNF